jgi:hypothetical protein
MPSTYDEQDTKQWDYTTEVNFNEEKDYFTTTEKPPRLICPTSMSGELINNKLIYFKSGVRKQEGGFGKRTTRRRRWRILKSPELPDKITDQFLKNVNNGDFRGKWIAMTENAEYWYLGLVIEENYETTNGQNVLTVFIPGHPLVKADAPRKLLINTKNVNDNTNVSHVNHNETEFTWHDDDVQTSKRTNKSKNTKPPSSRVLVVLSNDLLRLTEEDIRQPQSQTPLEQNIEDTAENVQLTGPMPLKFEKLSS